MPAILQVVQGDISTFEGDAIVNAANNHLRMGTGVAGALLRRGGGTIQDECDAIVRRDGPLEVGEAAITRAGSLLARHVIHAAAMGDRPPTPDSIRSATRRALELARKHGARAVAFPVPGAGVGGFPFADAARIVVDEVRRFTTSFAELDTIVFFGYTAEQAALLRLCLE